MNRQPPTIDMLPDGTFRAPPPRAGVPFSMKLGVTAVLVAAVGVSLTIAAIAVWVVSLILPVVIVAAAVAWGAMKWRRWQLVRGQGHPGAQAGPLRPGQPRGFGQ